MEMFFFINIGNLGPMFMLFCNMNMKKFMPISIMNRKRFIPISIMDRNRFMLVSRIGRIVYLSLS